METVLSLRRSSKGDVQQMLMPDEENLKKFNMDLNQVDGDNEDWNWDEKTILRFQWYQSDINVIFKQFTQLTQHKTQQKLSHDEASQDFHTATHVLTMNFIFPSLKIFLAT